MVPNKSNTDSNALAKKEGKKSNNISQRDDRGLRLSDREAVVLTFLFDPYMYTHQQADTYTCVCGTHTYLCEHILF